MCVLVRRKWDGSLNSKMNRRELIGLLILNGVADDYHNLWEILDDTGELAVQCGLKVQPSEVRAELMSLIEGGLVKSWRLSPIPPFVEAAAGVSPDGADSHYFLITDEGIQVLKSLAGSWPFDEDDRVPDGWVPPRD